MVAPVQITHSVVAQKIPVVGELEPGALAVNLADGALYTQDYDLAIRRIEGDTGNDSVASASTVNLGAILAAVIDVTGTTTINSIVLREGQTRVVRFAGILTLTNGADLILPGGGNITTAAGDYAVFRGYAAGVVRCRSYSPLAGFSATATVITNDTSTNTTVYPVWTTGTSGSQQIYTSNTRLIFNPSTGQFTASSFSGPLTGAVNGTLGATTRNTVAATSGDFNNGLTVSGAAFTSRGISDSATVANSFRLKNNSTSGQVSVSTSPGSYDSTLTGIVEVGGAGTGIAGIGANSYSTCNAVYNGGWKFGANGWASKIEGGGGTFKFSISSVSGTAGGGITWVDVMTISGAGLMTAPSVVATGGFGCNGKAAQTSVTANGTIATIETALKNCGIMV